MSGREDEYEEESNPSRRSILAVLGITGAATVGSAAWITHYLSEHGEKGRGRETPTERYDPTETYDEDRDEVTFTPDVEDTVENWSDAIPYGCRLSPDERHWLVSRVDSYDTLDGDDFFEYMEEGKVRMYESDGELRMEVDEDYRGGEFREDKGYNIPDAC